MNVKISARSVRAVDRLKSLTFDELADWSISTADEKRKITYPDCSDWPQSSSTSLETKRTTSISYHTFRELTVRTLLPMVDTKDKISSKMNK